MRRGLSLIIYVTVLVTSPNLSFTWEIQIESCELHTQCECISESVYIEIVNDKVTHCIKRTLLYSFIIKKASAATLTPFSWLGDNRPSLSGAHRAPGGTNSKHTHTLLMKGWILRCCRVLMMHQGMNTHANHQTRSHECA